MKETIKGAAQWFAAELARQFTKSQLAFTEDITLARFHALRGVSLDRSPKTQRVGLALGLTCEGQPLRVWGEMRELLPEKESRFTVPNPFPLPATVCGIEFSGSELTLVGVYADNLQLQGGEAPITPLVLRALQNTQIGLGCSITFNLRWRPNK